MSGPRNLMALLLTFAGMLVMVSGLVDKVRGEVFAVGGAAGWTVPHLGKVNYTEWAAMLSSLNVGDTLLFTYSSGEHNVVQVGEEDYIRCRATTPLATYTDGQTLVNLPKEGRYWFICGIPTFCSMGQKFVVDVVTPAFRAPAPSPTSGSDQTHGPRNSPLPTASGPDAAITPVSSLSISPSPAAFGPAPNPDNAAGSNRAQVYAVAVFSLVGLLLI